MNIVDNQPAPEFYYRQQPQDPMAQALYSQQSQPVSSPPVLPKKKVNMWVAIGCSSLLVLATLICGISVVATRSIATSSTSTDERTIQPTVIRGDTPAPAPTATPAPVHTLQHWSFNGNGMQKTQQFTTTSATWRLSWQCNPAAYGSEYNLIVEVDGTDGTMFDSAVNVICKSGVTSGSGMEYNASGTYYLSVTSEASWTIKIQEQ